MYQAYIFDLDGTLLDTLESLANCYNRALSKHGYPTHEVQMLTDILLVMEQKSV